MRGLAVAALAVALAWAPAHAQPAPPQAQPGRAEFVTLGTGGGPLVRLERAQPANAVVVGDAVYLFDVGDGTERQLAAARLPTRSLRAVFLSHHHHDHVGGLSPLLVSRWQFNVLAPIPVVGPPGTQALVRGLAGAFRALELAPTAVGGPAKPGIAATGAPRDLPADLAEPTEVFRDANIRVLAVNNDHYHFAPGSEEARSARSYAYRIEAGGRVFVFTGDTGPSAHVERLARGADVLVSEVIDMAAMERLLRADSHLPPPALAGLMQHMRLNHLTPEQVGELAARAGVKSVVLTHLAPGADGERNLAGYRDGVRQAYNGPVSVARDLERF